MNTIKFAPYNAFATEQHNIKTAHTSEHIINGKNYTFYEPCNLNVFITNRCPNRCHFCINRNNELNEVSDDKYFNNLEESLKILQGVRLEATITGGEPTLCYDRFVRTIELLSKYGVHCRTVSTTGWNLISPVDGKPHLLRMLQEYGFTHNISISRMSCDEKTNDAILGSRNITNDDLSRIGLYGKVNGLDIRTSCNLLQCSVHDLGGIIDYVDFHYANNIDSCLFRELENTENYIKIDKVFEDVRNNSNFVYMETAEGEFYTIDIYKYKSVRTGTEYIVKCYTGHKPNGSVIGSLSYNNGSLRIGFKGDIIYG